MGGRYEVIRLIGKGGMGAIYEVRNTRLGQPFALKTLTGDAASDPEVLQRFRREADVISKIKHPNIVEVIDWEALDDGSPAMVLEYLHGEDLASRIAAGPLPWPQLARIADQVLAALSTAHANGVVHRDLKPQNIFLAQDDSGDECVKLLDFGVSKVRDSKSLVTTDSRLLGTPAYMSPEQAEGRADDVGTHTDVWAVGTILHEMVTGELAFDGPSLPSILYKVCHGEAKPIKARRPDAPDTFIELLAETMARDIGKRISDATVLRVRLREALRDVAGVHFIDTLPGIRASQPRVRSTNAGLTPGGRRKRMTDALLDTIGAGSSEPKEPPEKLGTANTIASSSVSSPSIIARRKWAPVVLGLAGLAIAMVVIAFIVASREPPTPSAAQPLAKPLEVTPDAAPVAVEPPVDAAAAAAITEPVAVEPPPDVKAKTVKKIDKAKPVKEPIGSGAVKIEPVKTEPAKTEPKRKPCAKDDVECLYGDGT